MDYRVGEHPGLQANSMALDATGKFSLLAGSTCVAILSTEDPTKILKKVNRQSRWEVGCSQWCPVEEYQDKFIITYDKEGELNRWRMEGGDLTEEAVLKGHANKISGLSWHYRKADLVATACSSPCINMWDIRDCRQPCRTFTSTSNEELVSWNKASEYILASSSEGTLRLWDARKLIRPLSIIITDLNRITGMEWSTTQPNMMLLASMDPFLTVFNKIDPDTVERTSNTTSPILQAKYTPFADCVVTSLGNYSEPILPSAKTTPENSLILWKNDTLQEPLQTFTGHGNEIIHFDWKLEGCQLVSWSKDCSLRIWNVEEEFQQKLQIPTLIQKYDEESEDVAALLQSTDPQSDEERIDEDQSEVQEKEEQDKSSIKKEFPLVNINIDDVPMDESSNQLLVMQSNEESQPNSGDSAFFLMDDKSTVPTSSSTVPTSQGIIVQSEGGQQYMIVHSDKHNTDDHREFMFVHNNEDGMDKPSESDGGQFVFVQNSGENSREAPVEEQANSQFLLVQDSEAGGSVIVHNPEGEEEGTERQDEEDDGQQQFLLVQGNGEEVMKRDSHSLLLSQALDLDSAEVVAAATDSKKEGGLKANPGTLILVQGEESDEMNPGTSMTPEEARKVIQALQQQAQADSTDTMILLPTNDKTKEDSGVEEDESYQDDPNDPDYVGPPGTKLVIKADAMGKLPDGDTSQVHVLNAPAGMSEGEALDPRIIGEVLERNIIKKGEKAIITVGGRAYCLRIVDKNERSKQMLCDICHERFDTPEALKSHRLTHTSKLYKCQKCNRMFAHAQAVRLHRCGGNVSASAGRVFKCSICEAVFRHRCNYVSHMRIHTGERPYKCPFCVRSFREKGTLNTHVKTHTGDKPFTCSYCPKTFTTKALTKIHERIHTGEKPYGCEVCGRRFSQCGQLTTHRRLHTGERPYHCQYCPAKFRQWCEWNAHTQRHLKCKTKCGECGKMFVDQASYQAHQRTHLGEDAAGVIEEDSRPYKCNVCSRGFATANYLADHQMRGHSTIKNKCNVCGKILTSAASFKKHMERHQTGLIDDEEENKCTFKCGICQITFEKRYKLIQHLKQHTGQQAYACSYCETCCFSKEGLIYHVDNDHTDESPFPCRVCAVQFDKYVELEEHRKTHKRFVCPYCNRKVYVKKTALIEHIRIAHPGGNLFFCDDCGESFPERDGITNHRNTCPVRAHRKDQEATEKFIEADEVHPEQGLDMLTAVTNLVGSEGAMLDLGSGIDISGATAKAWTDNSTQEEDKTLDPAAEFVVATENEAVLEDSAGNLEASQPDFLKADELAEADNLPEKDDLSLALLNVFEPTTEETKIDPQSANVSNVNVIETVEGKTAEFNPNLLTIKKTDLYPFKCLFCDSKYAHQVKLANHITKEHPGNNCWGCNVCQTLFESKWAYRYHYRKEHIFKDSPWVVRAKRKESYLKTRLRTLRQKGKIEAALVLEQELNKLIKKTPEQLQHEFLHPSPKRREMGMESKLPCPYCNKKYTSKINLKNHIRIHITEAAQGKAVSIGKKPRKKSNPQKNRWSEEENADELEEDFFDDAYDEMEQLENEEEKVRYECSKCTKVFITKTGLQQHDQIHHSESPAEEQLIDGEKGSFSCIDCDASFPSRDGVENHWIDVHNTNQDEVKTDENAPRASDKENELWHSSRLAAKQSPRRKKKTHEVYYTPEEYVKVRLTPNEYKCDQCNAEFKRLLQLKYHYREDHGMLEHEIRVFANRNIKPAEPTVTVNAIPMEPKDKPPHAIVVAKPEIVPKNVARLLNDWDEDISPSMPEQFLDSSVVKKAQVNSLHKEDVCSDVEATEMKDETPEITKNEEVAPKVQKIRRVEMRCSTGMNTVTEGILKKRLLEVSPPASPKMFKNDAGERVNVEKNVSFRDNPVSESSKETPREEVATKELVVIMRDLFEGFKEKLQLVGDMKQLVFKTPQHKLDQEAEKDKSCMERVIKKFKYEKVIIGRRSKELSCPVEGTRCRKHFLGYTSEKERRKKLGVVDSPEKASTTMLKPPKPILKIKLTPKTKVPSKELKQNKTGVQKPVKTSSEVLTELKYDKFRNIKPENPEEGSKLVSRVEILFTKRQRKPIDMSDFVTEGSREAKSPLKSSNANLTFKPEIKKATTSRPVIQKAMTSKPVIQKAMTSKPVIQKATTSKPEIGKAATSRPKMQANLLSISNSGKGSPKNANVAVKNSPLASSKVTVNNNPTKQKPTMIQEIEKSLLQILNMDEDEPIFKAVTSKSKRDKVGDKLGGDRHGSLAVSKKLKEPPRKSEPFSKNKNEASRKKSVGKKQVCVDERYYEDNKFNTKEEMYADIVRMDAEAGYNDDIDSLDANIDNVDTNIDSMDAYVDNVDTTIDNVDANIDNVDANIDNVDANIDNVDTNIDNVDTNIDNVDTNIDDAEANIDNVECNIDDAEANIDNVECNIDNVDTNIDNVDTNIDNVDTNINNVDANIDNVDTNIDGVDANIDNVDANIDNVDGNIVDDDVDKLQTSPPKNNTKSRSRDESTPIRRQDSKFMKKGRTAVDSSTEVNEREDMARIKRSPVVVLERLSLDSAQSYCVRGKLKGQTSITAMKTLKNAISVSRKRAALTLRRKWSSKKITSHGKLKAVKGPRSIISLKKKSITLSSKERSGSPLKSTKIVMGKTSLKVVLNKLEMRKSPVGQEKLMENPSLMVRKKGMEKSPVSHVNLTKRTKGKQSPKKEIVKKVIGKPSPKKEITKKVIGKPSPKKEIMKKVIGKPLPKKIISEKGSGRIHGSLKPNAVASKVKVVSSKKKTISNSPKQSSLKRIKSSLSSSSITKTLKRKSTFGTKPGITPKPKKGQSPKKAKTPQIVLKKSSTKVSPPKKAKQAGEKIRKTKGSSDGNSSHIIVPPCVLALSELERALKVQVVVKKLHKTEISKYLKEEQTRVTITDEIELSLMKMFGEDDDNVTNSYTVSENPDAKHESKKMSTEGSIKKVEHAEKSQDSMSTDGIIKKLEHTGKSQDSMSTEGFVKKGEHNETSEDSLLTEGSKEKVEHTEKSQDLMSTEGSIKKVEHTEKKQFSMSTDGSKEKVEHSEEIQDSKKISTEGSTKKVEHTEKCQDSNKMSTEGSIKKVEYAEKSQDSKKTLTVESCITAIEEERLEDTETNSSDNGARVERGENGKFEWKDQVTEKPSEYAEGREEKETECKEGGKYASEKSSSSSAEETAENKNSFRNDQISKHFISVEGCALAERIEKNSRKEQILEDSPSLDGCVPAEVEKEYLNKGKRKTKNSESISPGFSEVKSAKRTRTCSLSSDARADRKRTRDSSSEPRVINPEVTRVSSNAEQPDEGETGELDASRDSSIEPRALKPEVTRATSNAEHPDTDEARANNTSRDSSSEPRVVIPEVTRVSSNPEQDKGETSALETSQTVEEEQHQ